MTRRLRLVTMGESSHLAKNYDAGFSDYSVNVLNSPPVWFGCSRM